MNEWRTKLFNWVEIESHFDGMSIVIVSITCLNNE